jgi:Ni/Co efflux regulator RcnB
MNKTIVTLLSVACLVASATASTAANAVPAVKEQHGSAVHRSSWTSGHRLSPSDRRRAQLVDARQYHLATPPHGFQWLRIGSSFLMVGQTSGLILRVASAR